MKKLCILIVSLLLIPILGASFYDISLTVNVKVNINGSAHVTENVLLALDPSSEDLYNRSIYSTQLTIMDWQQITQSQYLRQHVISTTAARNLEITPKDIQPYAYGSRSGADVELDYDIDNVVTINQTRPRILQYTFNSSSLSFQPSPSGQVLPRNNSLTIIIPPDSLVTSILPNPTIPVIQRDYAGQVSGVSSFTWRGTVPLMDFQLVFIREQSMDVEVMDFFDNLEETAISILLSAPGIVLTLLIVVAVAFWALNRR